jgi:hypothetical protein
VLWPLWVIQFVSSLYNDVDVLFVICSTVCTVILNIDCTYVPTYLCSLSPSISIGFHNKHMKHQQQNYPKPRVPQNRSCRKRMIMTPFVWLLDNVGVWQCMSVRHAYIHTNNVSTERQIGVAQFRIGFCAYSYAVLTLLSFFVWLLWQCWCVTVHVCSTRIYPYQQCSCGKTRKARNCQCTWWWLLFFFLSPAYKSTTRYVSLLFACSCFGCLSQMFPLSWIALS